MRMEYDPALIEKAVFLRARTDRKLEREYHAAIGTAYSEADPRSRDARFQQIHASLFEQFGLARIMKSLLEERPLIAGRVQRCCIRAALAAGKEMAELFAGSGAVGGSDAPGALAEARTLVLQVCPESLADPSAFLPRMRRELLHISDMLDPRFGYQPEEIAGSIAHQNLIRDRYRVLWDTDIEARLRRQGRGDEFAISRLCRMFARAFCCDDAQATQKVETLLQSPPSNHQQIFSMACSMSSMAGGAPTRPGGQKGAPCPLCGFPTHDWARLDEPWHEAVVETVRRSYPDWKPEEGACRQCAEIYDAVARSERLAAAGSPQT